MEWFNAENAKFSNMRKMRRNAGSGNDLKQLRNSSTYTFGGQHSLNLWLFVYSLTWCSLVSLMTQFQKLNQKLCICGFLSIFWLPIERFLNWSSLDETQETHQGYLLCALNCCASPNKSVLGLLLGFLFLWFSPNMWDSNWSMLVVHLFPLNTRTCHLWSVWRSVNSLAKRIIKVTWIT